MSINEDNLLKDAQWVIWYQDSFDAACPRQMEITGTGLVKGLVELWARHLYETVQPTGFLGFSHFNLWWKQGECSIEIMGKAAGQVKIRNWVYEARRLSGSKYVDIADEELLKSIAETHARLALKHQTSEIIITSAHLLNDREDFISQIMKL